MKNLIKYSILAFIFTTSACTPNQTATSQTTPLVPIQTANLNPQKAVGLWLDVRTAEEYQAGHLSDAVNIPHEQIATQIASVAPNKDAPIHLYCHSGRRADLALQTLRQLGYTQVHNHGAYADLVKQGFK